MCKLIGWPADAPSANSQKGRGTPLIGAGVPFHRLTPFSPHTSKTASDILYGPLLLIAPVTGPSCAPSERHLEPLTTTQQCGAVQRRALSTQSVRDRRSVRGKFAKLRMSALPPKADIGTQPRDVRFVPKATFQLLRLYVDVLLNNNR